jgi:hypothetical protein
MQNLRVTSFLLLTDKKNFVRVLGSEIMGAFWLILAQVSFYLINILPGGKESGLAGLFPPLN